MKNVLFAICLGFLFIGGCSAPKAVYIRLNTENPPIIDIYPEIQFEYEILR
jgi:hypothetical protein